MSSGPGPASLSESRRELWPLHRSIGSMEPIDKQGALYRHIIRVPAGTTRKIRPKLSHPSQALTQITYHNITRPDSDLMWGPGDGGGLRVPCECRDPASDPALLLLLLSLDPPETPCSTPFPRGEPCEIATTDSVAGGSAGDFVINICLTPSAPAPAPARLKLFRLASVSMRLSSGPVTRGGLPSSKRLFLRPGGMDGTAKVASSAGLPVRDQ